MTPAPDIDEPTNEVTIGLRRMIPQDRDYVVATWLENYRCNSDWARNMDVQVYWHSHQTMVKGLLDRHTTVVAYDPSDARICLGFLCGDLYPSAAVVHYASVRHGMRGEGIGRAMLEHLGWLPHVPILATHFTRDARRVGRKRHVLYNPYLIFKDFVGALNGRTTRGAEEAPSDASVGRRRKNVKRKDRGVLAVGTGSIKDEGEPAAE